MHRRAFRNRHLRIGVRACARAQYDALQRLKLPFEEASSEDGGGCGFGAGECYEFASGARHTPCERLLLGSLHTVSVCASSNRRAAARFASGRRCALAASLPA